MQLLLCDLNPAILQPWQAVLQIAPMLMLLMGITWKRWQMVFLTRVYSLVIQFNKIAVYTFRVGNYQAIIGLITT